MATDKHVYLTLPDATVYYFPACEWERTLDKTVTELQIPIDGDDSSTAENPSVDLGMSTDHITITGEWHDDNGIGDYDSKTAFDRAMEMVDYFKDPDGSGTDRGKAVLTITSGTDTWSKTVLALLHRIWRKGGEGDCINYNLQFTVAKASS